MGKLCILYFGEYNLSAVMGIVFGICPYSVTFDYIWGKWPYDVNGANPRVMSQYQIDEEIRKIDTML